jgi:hypothetical protein
MAPLQKMLPAAGCGSGRWRLVRFYCAAGRACERARGAIIMLAAATPAATAAARRLVRPARSSFGAVPGAHAYDYARRPAIHTRLTSLGPCQAGGGRCPAPCSSFGRSLSIDAFELLRSPYSCVSCGLHPRCCTWSVSANDASYVAVVGQVQWWPCVPDVIVFMHVVCSAVSFLVMQ